MLYRLNRRHALAEPVAELFRAEAARADVLFEGIRSVAERMHPPPVAVWLFGSVARGEDTTRGVGVPSRDRDVVRDDREPMGDPLWFEDLTEGREWTTAERTLTDEDITAFAVVSGDTNPLHLDDDYARTTPFGGRIAHGLLGLSIASGLVNRLRLTERTLVAWLGLQWDFKRPLRPGDTVRVRLRVVEARPTSDGKRGIVRYRVEVVDQADQVAQEGVWTMMVRRREG